jgi:AhpD family alkylhydroperoxidase
MTRVTPVPRSKFPVGARILDRITTRMFGQTLQSAALHAHSPSLVWSQAWMDRFVTGKRTVPSRLRELVCVRTAMELGCTFCMDLGSHAARLEGATVDEVLALTDHGASDLFTAGEKAAFDLAVAMSATPISADDELFARLSEHFDEQQVVELCATISWENYRSRLNVTFGLDAQGFSEPGACAVPARDVVRR